MRVLIAEDDRKLAELVAATLGAAGFVVERESDGEVVQFRGESEEFDAVLLDLGLPSLDDGDGLSDEQVKKLGERGVRLDERSEGTGLGLAIAFEIVRLNGGSIQLGRAASGGLKVRAQLVARS